MPPGLALFIGEQVAEALAYAHRLKSPMTGEHMHVVHRDVSPANVMVSFEGEVKLIDFGLAESSLKTEQTETRLVMGKVAYMAPEQARGEELDGSVDQFATAIVVYEALTGDRYYGDMNTHQIWQLVGVGGHVPRMWKGVDPDLQSILGTALSADPKARYPSSEAFRAALEEQRTTKYRGSGRAALRDLMNALYRDRIDAEADLIASFADLRAPLASNEGLESPTMKSVRPVVETGTDQWRNSPSDSNAAAPIRQMPGVPLVTHSATAPVSRPSTIAEQPSQSVSATLRPPPNTAARALTAVFVVGIVVVAAYLVWPHGKANAIVDAGIASVSHDAGVVALAVVDAGVAVVAVDAGTNAPVADASKPDGAHVKHADRKPVAGDVTHGDKHGDGKPIDVRPADGDIKPPDVKPSDSKPVDVKPADVKPADVTPADVKPVALTPQQEEMLVHRCVGKDVCAKTILDELPKLADPAKSKQRQFIFHTCAVSCSKAGVQ
jgi:serine/threonine-protein kinase